MKGYARTLKEAMLRAASGKILECWVWTISCDSKGYGKISRQINGKLLREKAHRVSWEHFNGPIPEGLCVLHRCDNPPCFNPNHLFLGTVIDNNADMMAKGRHVRGSQCGRSILTEEQVLAIKKEYVPYKVGYSKLAAQYGVSATTIQFIIEGVNWKHLGDAVGSR